MSSFEEERIKFGNLILDQQDIQAKQVVQAALMIHNGLCSVYQIKKVLGNGYYNFKTNRVWEQLPGVLTMMRKARELGDKEIELIEIHVPISETEETPVNVYNVKLKL